MTFNVYAITMIGHRDGGATVTAENQNNGAVIVERDFDDLDDALTYGNTIAGNVRRRVVRFWEVAA